MAQVVHANVFDPRNSLFKQPANARAECQTITCEFESCPLRDGGYCACRSGLFCGTCPYGKYRVETGPTKRAASFYSWVSDRKSQYKCVPHLKAPPKKMAFVGEYVYLPYPHMDSCESVDFVKRSSLFAEGTPFIHRDDWSIETVESLVSHVPRSLMGGEITSYRLESVPKFIGHLGECDAEMYQEFVSRNPSYNMPRNYVGRTAYLKTLTPNIQIPPKDNRYPVSWTWDGEKLRTTDRHGFNDTRGGRFDGRITIEIEPTDGATVVVSDNNWVTEATRFVD